MPAREELERFCPESVTDEPGFQPEGGEVDVIVSTDILSEGQNLQQAQAVLSFDMPWNPTASGTAQRPHHTSKAARTIPLISTRSCRSRETSTGF